MTWVGHVVYMGGKRRAYRALAGSMKEIDHKEDLGIDGRR
jgi:hypothetical protein